MAGSFLYEEYDALSKRNRLDKTIPDYVKDNLNQNFNIREYQTEAFARFIDYFQLDDITYPVHLLFNMATWSGKTFIMAGLILYLYEKGYRNFLFFVNSTNIIDKTKHNFLDTSYSKYLFNQTIKFDWKVVNIQEVDNFEWVNTDNINICFTTTHKLHLDLTTDRENSITIDDFKKEKIVLISDEAHHSQWTTKKKSWEIDPEEKSWEDTVENILHQHKKNILLEFTATLDYSDSNVARKYQDKILYRYDLRDFRNEWYSKDIELLKSNFEKKDRILQALILNQYRQEVAENNWISLKPVILFKANKTIEESKQNQEEFNQLIENLSVKDIENIRDKSDVLIIQKAFKYFENHNLSIPLFIQKLKTNFSPSKCINVNEANLESKSISKTDEQEVKSQSTLLNSLEDKDNKIRAIFAVNKLNEWWDVLNLFDIVRLYDTRSVDHATPGERNKVQKQTIAEAQLIWRWARYRAFSKWDSEKSNKRKYDNDTDNELRILEQLHYHSMYHSSYISELRNALIQAWLMDEKETVERTLEFKPKFKQTNLFQEWFIFLNDRVVNTYDWVKSIWDLWVKRKNIEYELRSWTWKVVEVFSDEDEFNEQNRWTLKKETKTLYLKDIDTYIIKNALAKNDFYNFDSLKIYFKDLRSTNEFITNDNYLASLWINFIWPADRVNNLTNQDKFLAVTALLNEIEKEMKPNITSFKWTKDFKPHSLKSSFPEKQVLNIELWSNRANWEEEYLKDKDWYAFNANYWTSEEKEFIKLIDTMMENLKKEYDDIYIVRNEKQVKIYSFIDWQAFEPDFIMFLKEKNWDFMHYQIFIEPKWEHLFKKDERKEKFLEDIKNEKIVKVFKDDEKIRITWVPMFYNSDQENKFKEVLLSTLEDKE